MRDRTEDEVSHGDPDVVIGAHLETLPKVELHVHLEGSIRSETATALARHHGEDPEEVLPFVDGTYPRRFDDFGHFVRTYLAVSGQVRSPDDLHTIARDFALGQRAQNVGWTEATFTASTLASGGMPVREMWQAVTAGLAEVPDAPVGLIIDVVRDYGPENARATLDLVETGLGLGAPIVAVGLAGSETVAGEADFPELAPGATALGLPIVAHAGETGTAENVWRALDLLGSRRIGHGIASINDARLVERLRQDGTVLEVCPTSNVVLGIVEDHASHPLPAMAAAGLAVTVNSDDPPFFSTTLTRELAIAERMLHLDEDGLRNLQLRALDASFAPPDVRRSVREGLHAWPW